MNLKLTKWILLFLVFSLLTTPVRLQEEPAEEEAPADAPAEEEAPAAEGEEAPAEGTEGDTPEGEATGGSPKPKEEEDSGPKKICNQELAGALGMKGVATAIEDEMEMCPGISFSCCEVKDQLIMYDNWTKIEEPKLKSSIKAHYDVYVTVLNELAEVEIGSRAMLVKLENGPDNNCKALATRISQLKIREQAEKLKIHIEELHNYIVTMHKGIYCSVCDADQQRYFKVDKKELVLSRNTCREVVGKSMVFLLYFHVHLNRVMNLVAMYVNGCDADGVFTEKAIPNEFVFSPDGDVEKLIIDSRENRNKMDWFKYFKPVCDRLNVTQYPELLMPNVKKIEAFTAFIRDLIKTHSAAKETEELVQKTVVEENKGGEANNLARLLQQLKDEEKKDENVEDEKEKEKLETDLNEAEREKDKIQQEEHINIYDPFPIYIGSLTAVVPVNDFNTVFEDPGLDLYDSGVCTVFEEPIYQKILEMKDPTEGGVATDKGGDKSVQIVGVRIAVLILFVGSWM